MKATYYVAIETKLSLSRAIVTEEVLDMIVHQLRNQHHGVDFSTFSKHIHQKRRRFSSQTDRTEERSVGKECRSRWLPKH